MSLAPFFDKTALAAAAVLSDFDRDQFAATLTGQSISIAFDADAAQTSEGRITLSLMVNLCARLYPVFSLKTIGASAGAFAIHLASLGRAINPHIELTCEDVGPASNGDANPTGLSPSTSDDVFLVVGRTTAIEFGRSAEMTPIYVGSNGWEAGLSTSRPVGSGLTDLPFGAAAAACLGAANLFRHVFRAQLPNPRLDDELTLSTLSLGVDVSEPPSLRSDVPTDIGPLDFQEAFLAGAGAVGQAVLWTLVRTRGLTGRLHVVDSEVIDLTNPQRYILTRASDIGLVKVDIAAAAAGVDSACSTDSKDTESTPAAHDVSNPRYVDESMRASIHIVPHRDRWGEFLAKRPCPWALRRVLVALDSARDRVAVQASLPLWIGNAWTQPGDLGLSVHTAFGSTACLACLYVPVRAAAKNEDELIGEAVGLSDDPMLVRQLLATGAPVDIAVLTRMGSALGVAIDSLLMFVGRPLRAFYSEAICGGVVFRLQGALPEHADESNESDQIHGARTDGAPEDASTSPGVEPPTQGQPRDRGAMVPMAFQSALAGILLAAAFVADAAGIPAHPTGRKAVVNLLRQLPGLLSVPVAFHPSGKCLCQDPDFIDAFNSQWGTADPAAPMKGASSQQAALLQDGERIALK